MGRPPLTRRTFLAGLAALGLAVLGRRTGGAAAASQRSPTDVFWRDLVRLLPHQESARVVGAAYLRRRPEEASVSTLLGLLGLSGARPIHTRALRTRHYADFRAGRVEQLRGWTLSLTELRLCALVRLAGGPAPGPDPAPSPVGGRARICCRESS